MPDFFSMPTMSFCRSPETEPILQVIAELLSTNVLYQGLSPTAFFHGSKDIDVHDLFQHLSPQIQAVDGASRQPTFISP